MVREPEEKMASVVLEKDNMLKDQIGNQRSQERNPKTESRLQSNSDDEKSLIWRGMGQKEENSYWKKSTWNEIMMMILVRIDSCTTGIFHGSQDYRTQATGPDLQITAIYS